MARKPVNDLEAHDTADRQRLQFVLAVDPSEITHLIKSGKLKRGDGGRLDVDGFLRDKLASLRDRKQSADAKERLTLAQAEREELELAERRGELVAASRVQDTLAQLAAVFRRGRVQHGEEFARAVQQAVAEWHELTVKGLQAEDING